MVDGENSLRCYTHIGNSMIPTLKALDQVFVTEDRRFGPGDIILFTEPLSGRKIVHRVLSVKGNRIITRGDNNPVRDSYVISPEKVLGKVAYARRDGKTIGIRGGWPGMAAVAPHRAYMKLCQYSIMLALMPYHALARSGIFRIWLPDSMKQQVITLKGSSGPELRIMMGKRLAGVWRPGLAGWLILPPYKLFLDERSLPGVPSCGGTCGTTGASDDDRGDNRL